MNAGRVSPLATQEEIRCAGRPFPGVGLAVVALPAEGICAQDRDRGARDSNSVSISSLSSTDTPQATLCPSSVLRTGQVGELVIGGLQVGHVVPK
jgi:hypothetical protein